MSQKLWKPPVEKCPLEAHSPGTTVSQNETLKDERLVANTELCFGHIRKGPGCFSPVESICRCFTPAQSGKVAQQSADRYKLKKEGVRAFGTQILMTVHHRKHPRALVGHMSVEESSSRLLAVVFAMPAQRPNTSRSPATHCVPCSRKPPCLLVKISRTCSQQTDIQHCLIRGYSLCNCRCVVVVVLSQGASQFRSCSTTLYKILCPILPSTFPFSSLNYSILTDPVLRI